MTPSPGDTQVSTGTRMSEVTYTRQSVPEITYPDGNSYVSARVTAGQKLWGTARNGFIISTIATLAIAVTLGIVGMHVSDTPATYCHTGSAVFAAGFIVSVIGLLVASRKKSWYASNEATLYFQNLFRQTNDNERSDAADKANDFRKARKWLAITGVVFGVVGAVALLISYSAWIQGHILQIKETYECPQGMYTGISMMGVAVPLFAAAGFCWWRKNKWKEIAFPGGTSTLPTPSATVTNVNHPATEPA